MLIVLPLRSMSCILGNSSSFQAADDDQFCRYFFPLSAKKGFKKFFVYLMMTNIMVKACLNQEIMKISNLIQEKIKNNACPRPKFNRRPNLSESRISPNVPKFRSVDWTHDMIIVKWHLLIWHKRKFCALTNRPPAQSTRTGQWLSTLFHANCSAAQVYVLHPWQFIFVPSCRRRSVLQVFLSSKR